MASSPARRILRAALAGLTLACGLGGLALVGVGAWNRVHPPACEDLGRNECELQRDTTRELSQYQLFAGAALLLLGAGLVPGVRRSA